MRLPKLDNRLSAIYRMLGESKSICDVGADHGRLSLILAKEGRRVIATDISAPSLDKVRRIAEIHKANIDCRLGDGLSVVKPGQAEAIVLAGMGQNTIINIINQSREVVSEAENIIIQSMNGEYDLRDFLSREGYLICNEQIAIESNRIYCIIKAVPRGGEKLTEVQKFFGPRLLEKPKQKNTNKYFEYNVKILEDILAGMEVAGEVKSIRYNNIKSVLGNMEAII